MPHRMQLYAADGIAEAVDFEMHSAIRSAGNVTKDHAWDCPDEDSGCPMSRFASHSPACPLNGTQDLNCFRNQVVFVCC